MPGKRRGTGNEFRNVICTSEGGGFRVHYGNALMFNGLDKKGLCSYLHDYADKCIIVVIVELVSSMGL